MCLYELAFILSTYPRNNSKGYEKFSHEKKVFKASCNIYTRSKLETDQVPANTNVLTYFVYYILLLHVVKLDDKRGKSDFDYNLL